MIHGSVIAVSAAENVPILVQADIGGVSVLPGLIPVAVASVLEPWYWLLEQIYGLTGLDMLNPRYRFMHRAILVGLCIGVIAPLVGTFLVHRRLALIGDALAHTAFAGVAVGLFVNAVLDTGVSPYVTAVIVSVIAALAIELISEKTDAYNDVSMAIVLSTGFALGTVLISLNAGGLSVGIDQYLFGNLATVSEQNATIMLALFAVIVSTIAVTRHQLLYVTFDETAAAVAGIPVAWYNRVMVTMTALVVVGAMQIMGVILVAAMLVVPVAAAAQVSDGFTESVFASIALAELSVLLGIAVAYYGGATAGGVIVLVAVGIYLLSVGFGRVQDETSLRFPEAITGTTEDADQTPD